MWFLKREKYKINRTQQWSSVWIINRLCGRRDWLMNVPQDMYPSRCVVVVVVPCNCVVHQGFLSWPLWPCLCHQKVETYVIALSMIPQSIKTFLMTFSTGWTSVSASKMSITLSGLEWNWVDRSIRIDWKEMRLESRLLREGFFVTIWAWLSISSVKEPNEHSSSDTGRHLISLEFAGRNTRSKRMQKQNDEERGRHRQSARRKHKRSRRQATTWNDEKDGNHGDFLVCGFLGAHRVEHFQSANTISCEAMTSEWVTVARAFSGNQCPGCDVINTSARSRLDASDSESFVIKWESTASSASKKAKSPNSTPEIGALSPVLLTQSPSLPPLLDSPRWLSYAHHYTPFNASFCLSVCLVCVSIIIVSRIKVQSQSIISFIVSRWRRIPSFEEEISKMGSEKEE